MTYGETQKHGATYHWCKPEFEYLHWRAAWKEMYMWAVANFGEHIPYSTVRPRRWFAADQQFYFLKDEDRMHMIMRWA